MEGGSGDGGLTARTRSRHPFDRRPGSGEAVVRDRRATDVGDVPIPALRYASARMTNAEARERAYGLQLLRTRAIIWLSPGIRVFAAFAAYAA